MSAEANQVPLVELLRCVPVDTKMMVIRTPYTTSYHPVGQYCHAAAADLDRLRAEVEGMRGVVETYDKLHEGKLGAHWLWCVIEQIAAGVSEVEAMRGFGYYEPGAVPAVGCIAYLVTNLPSGEPSLCFEDERGDYGDEDYMPVFTPLVVGVPAVGQVCTWSLDEDDSGTWATSCGNLFSFTDGGPKENDFKHCCYCGGKLASASTAGGGEG